MKPLTRIAIVLDKSGSMGNDHGNPTRVAETVEGYNKQIREIVSNAQSQDIKVSLFTFNQTVYEHIIDADAKELTEASVESYQPNGWTAWYDGLGYSIDKLKDLGKNDPECSYLVITISDGQENHSTHYNSNTLRQKIDECKATGKWIFSFMGCSDSDIKEFRETTGSKGSFQWSNKQSGETSKSMRYASAKLGDYLDNRSKGIDMKDEDYWLPVGAFGPMGPSGCTGSTASYGDAGVSLNCASVDIQLTSYVDKAELASTDSTFSKGNVAKWN